MRIAGTPHKSHSGMQKQIEEELVRETLPALLQVHELKSCCYTFSGNSAFARRCVVDFASGLDRVYREIYVHTGRLKVGGRNKILKDCLKLLAIEEDLGTPLRKYIVVTYKSVSEAFENTWMHLYMKKKGIELITVPLSPEQEAHLKAAQQRQARGMKEARIPLVRQVKRHTGNESRKLRP
jgi:hypothetical protein